MKLTHQSITNFNFIKQNYKHLLKYTFDEKTNNILKELYEIIGISFSKFNNTLQILLNDENNKFIKQETYSGKSNIAYPLQFEKYDFPSQIITYIENEILKQKRYTFLIKGRKINVYIGYEVNSNVNFQFIIEKILIWINILTYYSSHKCSQELSIYLYLTSLKKELPNNGEIIDWINVNTAFTRSCRPTSEIVIYRKEEWFKVLIHETFHCFGLDFSHMNKTNEIIQRHMDNIFNVDVQILLYETYTELWAEILNEMIFIYIDNPVLRTNYNQYVKILEQIVNYQRLHCVLITNKILSFYNTNYYDIINMTKKSNYNENTFTFSYYVIKMLLFIHFKEMIVFCKKNNITNILQFTHTLQNVENFCIFIKQIYKSKEVLQLISNVNTNYKNNYIQMDLYDFLT